MEPDDIYWTARAAVDGLPEVNRDFVIAAMARAILAERKRCADAVLAEKLAGETSDPTDISYNVAIEHAHDAIWRTA